MTHPTEQIEAAVMGGLTPSEQAAFDEHVAGCPACAALLADAKGADAAMNELFSSDRPDEDFEERMINNIRRRQVRITHPLVRRIAVGVAASIVLGGIGYVGSAGISGGRLPGYALIEGIKEKNSRSPGHVASYGGDTTVIRHVAGSASLDSPGVDAGRAARDGNYRQQPAYAIPAPVTASPAPTSESKPYGTLKLNMTNEVHAAAPPSNTNLEDGFKTRILPSAIGLDSNTDTYAYAGGAHAPAATPSRTPVAKLAEAAKESASGYFKISDGDQRQAGSAGRGGDLGSKSAGDSKLGVDGLAWGQNRRDSSGSPAFASPAGPALRKFNVAAAAKNDEINTKDSLGKSVTQERDQMTTPGEAGKKSAIALVSPAEPAKPDQQAAAAENPPTPPHDDTAHPDVLGKPKIIRTGEMEFEVDSFDSTVGIVNKVIAEETGYISTTNSDKLANGKVKGSIVLRVPAEHLDTLVLKLRGIGDLRSQHINAQDITKQFTDTESALRAAKAMQERLLDIIKNGKGAVKDLLEAEKQLGVWREKVEQLEGEIRYYSNQVALSTLTLTLFERDIRTPALASETEMVTMALETDKVDDAYARAKDAIVQAKGRIINSELKQFDAGQFGATITAQVPPDAADAVIGRLKQFEGRVARFERQRNQTTSNGNERSDGRISAEPVKVKREDVTISLTLYNLANVAPRRTTTLTVVAGDVEKSYHALIDQVRAAGGRVVTSQINRAKDDQVAGSINFNVPTEKADELLATLRGWGEVLKTETAESPDTQNVTESKRGFILTIGSLSAFPARETQSVQLAAVNVPDAFNDLLNAVRTHAGRIINSRLNELDRGNTNATLEFEIGRDAAGVVEQAMAKGGQIITRQVNRSTDMDNTVDSKLHIALAIGSSEQLPPRQSTDISVEVSDVQKAMDDLQAAALSAGGRQIDNPAITQGDGGQTIATLTVDVPLDKAASLIESADGKGIRKSRRTSIDAHAPEGKLARARLTVTFATPATLTGSNDGVLAGIRNGLGTSMRGLSYSLTMIIIGVCLVAPWVLLIAGIWRAVKWARKNRATAPVAG